MSQNPSIVSRLYNKFTLDSNQPPIVTGTLLHVSGLKNLNICDNFFRLGEIMSNDRSWAEIENITRS